MFHSGKYTPFGVHQYRRWHARGAGSPPRDLSTADWPEQVARSLVVHALRGPPARNSVRGEREQPKPARHSLTSNEMPIGRATNVAEAVILCRRSVVASGGQRELTLARSPAEALEVYLNWPAKEVGDRCAAGGGAGCLVHTAGTSEAARRFTFTGSWPRPGIPYCGAVWTSYQSGMCLRHGCSGGRPTRSPMARSR